MLRILIIRPGAIGDTLLTFPIISALRAAYAAEHITLVGNAAVLPLALTAGIVEAVADYEQRQWSELFLSSGIHSSTMLSLLEQTDLVICWLRDSDGVVRSNLLQAGVQHLILAPGRPPERQRVHIIDYLASTVELPIDPVGADVSSSSPMYRSTGRTDTSAVGTIHRPLRLLQTRSTIAIHPGSGGARKCWPITSFATVIERLWQRGYAILLLAGPADHELLATLQRILPTPPQPQMLQQLVDVPLIEVAHALIQCQGYVGNDSGITHLAAMLGIPTVAIFGPSDPAIWRPVGTNVEVLYEPDLRQLTVENVVAKLPGPVNRH